MDELISALVSPRHQAHVHLLMEDAGSRDLIRQQLSQLAEDNAGLIPQKSFSWILCKLTTFGAKEPDTFRIYRAFISQLTQLGQMCCLFSDEGENCKCDPPAVVADRITIGLGLFYEQAVYRHQRRAAPSPQFYQQLATSCFTVTGYKSIGAKLPEWLEFLRTNFVPPKLNS